MPRLTNRSSSADRGGRRRSDFLLIVLGKLGTWAAKRHLAQARKLRDRAAECRALAKVARNEGAAVSHTSRADKYEQLAREQTDLADAYEL